MKQLHKQSSLNQTQLIPTYAAKPAKPQARPSSAASSPLRAAAGYLLREQRLLFVLAGAVIASTFFLLHPYYHSLSRLHPYDHLSHRLLPTFRHPSSPSFSASDGGGSVGVGGGGRRIPVGLKKPSKRVVVTGGAGFVGSHLVDKLLGRGDSVIVIDNFFTGRKDNVVHHFGNPRFELIRHDVVEPILLEVDEIYHLACPASPFVFRSSSYELVVRIARIFNTYGPRMCLDDGRVVSNFVAQVVKEVIDSSATIEFRPNTADDPHMRKPDISKAKELLNWEPKVTLRQGLPLMVTDFQKRLLSADN
ncbi:hypothetical protein B296_00006986 [Ensete ventricosum]|uniref:UDP-glucuronate decarboxylase n=1 Tax=Ensete ventricosum TaxID=4639 RepID=A0A426ZV87_ENSVE|nr:hypothetical protein B296_00006986 [Ensete ventricosum]